MLFDIKSIIDIMKKVLLVSLGENKPAIVTAVTGYIKDAESRLANLAAGALSGELSFKFVTERLKEETVNIKDQVLSVEQIVAADIETLAARAVGIFEDAIKDAIFKKLEL